MPTHLLPRNSSAHRIAAIALYRALLTQCRALTALEAQQRNELQNIVRNRFKQARHEQSARRLTLNFEAGYEAIDHLDAAVAGDEGCRSYIVDLLAMAPDKVKSAPPVVLSKRLEKEIKKRQRQAAEEAGGGKEQERDMQKKLSLFDRPLPLEKLSGKRHIPVLFSAQKIPVVRFKKPQPENLSGYLAHRVRVRQKRHDTRHRLEDELEIARSEDRWDGILSKLAGSDGMATKKGKGGEPAWSAAVGLARKDVEGSLEEEKRRNAEMAERMQGVVDRERESYEREKVEKEEMRKARWIGKMREWKRVKKDETSRSTEAENGPATELKSEGMDGD